MSTAKARKSHKTTNMAVVRAPVDVNMVPLIKWLNSHIGITTLFCCQGDASLEKSERYSPYVMFISMSQESLVSIARIMPQIIKLDWYESLLRYTAHFSSQYSYYRFVEKEIPKEFKRGFKWDGKIPEDPYSIKTLTKQAEKLKKSTKKPKKKAKKKAKRKRT